MPLAGVTALLLACWALRPAACFALAPGWGFPGRHEAAGAVATGDDTGVRALLASDASSSGAHPVVEEADSGARVEAADSQAGLWSTFPTLLKAIQESLWESSEPTSAAVDSSLAMATAQPRRAVGPEPSSEAGTGAFSAAVSLQGLSISHWGHVDILSERNPAEPRQPMFEAQGWGTLALFVATMLLLDVVVLRRTVGRKVAHHGCLLSCWVIFAGVFAAYVLSRYGSGFCWQWCSGYALEWLLSMDNLFIFHVIFRSYRTPPRLLHKALFFGIVGALLARMIFFVLLHNLMHLHFIFRWLFGALLIFSGVQAALDEEEEPDDPRQGLPVRLFSWLVGDRLYDGFDDEGRFFVVKDGRRMATLLVPVVFCLEVTDIIFAVDSVSAKTAQIPDQFMNYSSSVFAMFGLRAMFFIMDDLMKCFDLMKYGLCVILVYVGAELLFARYFHLPASAVCVLIVSVFFVCATASVMRPRFQTFMKRSSCAGA